MRGHRIHRGVAWGAAVLLACLLAQALPAAPGPAAEKTGKSATSANVQPVDINRADENGLAKIPGIGMALAKRIVEFRKEHGPFRRPEDLMKVRGIGEKSFQKIRPYIKVGKTP